MGNLAVVYFLEYMCITCFADKVANQIRTRHPDKADSYVYQNCFIMFNFSY